MATFADTIRHIKPSALAKHVKRSTRTVSKWRMGQTLPEVIDLPEIAELLPITLEELTRLVAAESRTRR